MEDGGKYEGGIPKMSASTIRKIDSILMTSEITLLNPRFMNYTTSTMKKGWNLKMRLPQKRRFISDVFCFLSSQLLNCWCLDFAHSHKHQSMRHEIFGHQMPPKPWSQISYFFSWSNPGHEAQNWKNLACLVQDDQKMNDLKDLKFGIYSACYVSKNTPFCIFPKSFMISLPSTGKLQQQKTCNC